MSSRTVDLVKRRPNLDGLRIKAREELTRAVYGQVELSCDRPVASGWKPLKTVGRLMSGRTRTVISLVSGFIGGYAAVQLLVLVLLHRC